MHLLLFHYVNENSNHSRSECMFYRNGNALPEFIKMLRFLLLMLLNWIRLMESLQDDVELASFGFGFEKNFRK